ncbi:MAG: oxidoreductase [Gammaproteobacteria bacterium]|nr:oxidoreductase [Gammaproteobacteria bacterium]
MAVLWSKQIAGTRYQVRTAGRTRRLYTDGVFHSQYQPERLHTGGVWDLLMMPALFYAPGHIRRILLMGVGGGSVIHLLRHYIQPEVIDGIELNPVHLQIARRFFGISPSLANLVQADAIAWLQNYSGPRYDMIIDDLYGEEDGEPRRAVDLDSSWLSTIRKHLSPQGVMVLNTMSSRTLKQAACFTHAPLSKSFQSAYQLHLPVYHNAVGAVFRQPVQARGLRRRLAEYPALNQLDFRMRRLK